VQLLRDGRRIRSQLDLPEFGAASQHRRTGRRCLQPVRPIRAFRCNRSMARGDTPDISDPASVWGPGPQCLQSIRRHPIAAMSRITDVTRRRLIEGLAATAWYGVLNEVEFLGRLYELDTLPTTDSRSTQFPTAREDIIQHLQRNRPYGAIDGC
jgi:hypothetical protein